MARWVAIFEDVSEDKARPIRQHHDKQHFDYLAKNSGEILIAGGLRPDEGVWFLGGLWVLEVPDKARAIALCENDPYYKLGLRKSYRLYRWGKAPCYGDVTL